MQNLQITSQNIFLFWWNFVKCGIICRFFINKTAENFELWFLELEIPYCVLSTISIEITLVHLFPVQEHMLKILRFRTGTLSKRYLGI